MRQDYIEPEYIDGVYDKDGNQLIRPMNDTEKRFLNSFYEEVIGANFIHDSELSSLSKELKTLKKLENLTEDQEDELMRLQLEYYALADEVLLYPDSEDQKKLYGENNARNRCVYNRSKSIGILDELNEAIYDDHIVRNVYNNPEAAEQLLMNKIEPKLKTILRKKKKP